MAKEDMTEFLKLPPEVRAKLEASGKDITKAERTLAALRTLGMDTTILDEKLAFAKTARTTLLKEFK